MIKLFHNYRGKETGQLVTPHRIYRDHEVQETFVVYTKQESGEVVEVRIKAFKMFYKLIL